MSKTKRKLTIEKFLTNIPRALRDDARAAFTAASQAQRIIVEGYGKDHEISRKNWGDLVIEVALRAHRAILEVLKNCTASHVESELTFHMRTRMPEEYWLVDPLDATSAYLHRAGKQFPSVLIALERSYRTELAVAVFPLTDEWYYAVRGMGAFKGDRKLGITPVDVPLENAWVDMNQYGDARCETDEFKKLRERLRGPGGAGLVTSQAPHSGASLRIAEGAPGISAVIHDGDPDHPKQQPWDIAAPQLILEEAGGAFVNLDGQYINPIFGELIIAAQSHALAQEIIALVRG